MTVEWLQNDLGRQGSPQVRATHSSLSVVCLLSSIGELGLVVIQKENGSLFLPSAAWSGEHRGLWPMVT